MRSVREIRFRLSQQIANLGLLAFSPRLTRRAKVQDLPLPESASVAATLRGSAYAQELLRLAEEILHHRFPVLGITISTGPEIAWRRDYVHGKETGTSYFRFVPYLNFAEAGDHKNIWELSRHQHLVLLAQAFLIESRPAYLQEIEAELESWWQQNPFLKGMNWASALEVAFRALSWLWLDHLVGSHFHENTRRQLHSSLYQHGRYLQHNLSTYFSPNTHLLGEGVAIYALGIKFPGTQWRNLGEQIVEEEWIRQVQADGSHFEQSTYYHVYALDFFLLYYVLAGRPARYAEPIQRMATFLAAINGPSGKLSFLGDDDGGRLFHPYGDRAAFGRATLTTCAILFPRSGFPAYVEENPIQAAWWLGSKAVASLLPSTQEATLFPNSGIVAVAREKLHLLIDAGPFGPGGAGHSHSDTLSLVIRYGESEVLLDPGTYTYVADPAMRDLFRGSAMHNTVRVGGRDQADPVKPFRWENKPAVQVKQWQASTAMVFLDAECAYREFRHRRRFVLVENRILFVLDEVSGGAEEQELEQFWHVGQVSKQLHSHGFLLGEAALLFASPGTPVVESSWRSHALAEKVSSSAIALRWKATLPQTSAAAFVFGKDARTATELQLENAKSDLVIRVPGVVSIRLPEQALPLLVPE